MKIPTIVLIGISLVFLFYQDFIAKIVWNKFQNYSLALRLVRSNPELSFEIGNYYFNGGAYDLNRAEVAYKRTLEIKPRFFLGNYQLARVFFVKGQTELALEAINNELEYYPENQRSYYIRGLIYSFSGKLPEAEEDFKIFTKWAPTEWAGWNDLIWILAKEGKYEESVFYLSRAFEKVPDASQNVWFQNSLGVVHLNLKNYKKAKEAFLIARELSKKMELKDWLLAYPGNDSATAQKGFNTFKAAIEKNLFQARFLDKKQQ